MIRTIRADRGSFKALAFGDGLNILLADKREGSTVRDSRNGSGKTSFVELVHFLCGANAPPGNIFRADALREWRFEMELGASGGSTTVARSGATATVLQVSGALAPTTGSLNRLGMDGADAVTIGVEPWKAVLAKHWFGLDAPKDEKFRPSFRSLLSYLARRTGDEGFLGPMQYSTRQQPWDRQVSVSYLLGLDWTIAQRFQGLREREKGLRGLKQAVQSGELARFNGRVASLRTALTVARDNAKTRKERLAEFRVLPDYEDLEKEADDLTGRIGGLEGRNVADAALLRDLETSIDKEEESDQVQIRKVFEEAGVVIPDLVRRRFDEVSRFHRRVVENRRSHLNAEIESARDRIAARQREGRSLDGRRRQVMAILDTGGALAHYMALREEVGRLEADALALEERLRDAERLESLRTELKAERARLKRALLDDIRERDETVRQAILRFERLSERLYERAGSLTIGAGDGGPKFEVTIPSGRSRGITNMQVFCLDLMLMELQAERGASPGFLIHDSHLFDGVDERQVARALQLGAQRAKEFGFQYIVTLNTDAIPREGFDSGFAIEDYFMEVRLTDAREDGGLFGVRFD